MKLIELLVKKHNEEGWEWPDLTGDIIQTHSGNVYIELISSRALLFRAESIADDRVLVIVTREQYEAALSASKEMLINKPQPLWNGEHPIPQGAEVEVHFDGDDSRVWTTFRVEYMRDDVAVLFDYRTDSVDAYRNRSLNFRPIRTEAERKREQAISKLIDAICGAIPDTGLATAAKYAARTYEAIAAGKIPGVKLEAPDA